MRVWLMISLLTLTCGAFPSPLGRWKIFHGDGTPIWVTLYPDHSARSSWGSGEVGRWSLNGERLELTWTDGWRDHITRVGGKFRKTGYAPGNSGQPSNRTAAYKVSSRI